MPAQGASGLRGRLRAIGPQGGALRASAPVGPNPGQMLGRLGGALRGAGNALMGAGQAAAARIPTLYAPPQAAGAAARGSRSVASVLGRVAANPRILANPYTAAAAGTLALGAWAASSGGGGNRQGGRSGGGQYFGPGYMPDAAIFPQGRGRVGGGNAGASSAADWSGGAVPASNTTPVGYGAPPVVGTPAARTQRERVNEMLQNAGVQQPLPPMESLKPYWAENPEIAKAAAEGPRSVDVGYSDRADIQEWMNAMNKSESGRAIVDRFLEQQRKRGLIKESDGNYSPVFSQQQLADVDATQSPAFSQGRDKILSMQGSMLEPPSIDQLWGPGFRKSEPVNWDSAMDADFALPGSGAARRRDELNKVLEMPGAMAGPAPTSNPGWAAGYSQSPPVNWDAAVNSRHNIPDYEVPSQPARVPADYGNNPGVNWNAAMNSDVGYKNPVAGDTLEMGQRFTNPDEQRRYRAGLMLNNQIQGLKRYWKGGQ